MDNVKYQFTNTWERLPNNPERFPVTTKEKVLQDVAVLNASYAQACVRLKFTEADIIEVDAPSLDGGDTDVLGPDQFSINRLPGVHVKDNVNNFADEEKAIYKIHDNQDTATAEIRIYYVNRLHLNRTHGAKGKVVRPSTRAKWKNRILRATFAENSKFTLAHEVLHILFDSEHWKESIMSDLFYRNGTKETLPLDTVTKRIPMKKREDEPLPLGQVRAMRNSPLLEE